MSICTRDTKPEKISGRMHLRSSKVKRKFTSCTVFKEFGSRIYYEMKTDDGFIAHLVVKRNDVDYEMLRSKKPNMVIHVDTDIDADLRIIEEGFTLDI